MFRERRRALLNFACGGLLAGAAVLASTTALAECRDLPQSTLQLYSVEAVEQQNVHVAKNGLTQEFSPDLLVIRHSLMLIVSNVVGVTEINNRVFWTADGTICGSPDLVRIGFGSTQRMTFLVQPAADDDCVRRKMLDHREAHARALDDTVLRFIDEQQGILQQGMTALKKTPAPSAKAVEDQWHAGLQLVVSVARQRLITEMRAASARVDDGSVLTDLANSCDGKIRRLDQYLEMNP